ncbi:MAG: glycoside hydrolase family 1 protein [bacterium]
MHLMLGVVILIALYTVCTLFFRLKAPEIHWDWRKIDENAIDFPEGFIWGAATAAHQVEGGCRNNNWAEWEQSVDEKGAPRVRHGETAGEACDHWNRYEADIMLMKALGLRSYRFSVEWSKIEPEAGRFDQAILDHYADVITALKKADIEPMITLYHFTHPIWFRKLGGFETIENLDYFVRFCEHVFTAFGDRVTKWCTINEIEVEATQGYFSGVWPPGRKDPAMVGVVMKNLLEAHVRVYAALKKLPHGKAAKIGLVKNIFQFDPWRSWHLMDNILGFILNHVFNGAILRFLETGRFRIFVPGLMTVTHSNPDAVLSNDFIGLNYYSHFMVKARWNPGELFEFKIRPGETATDMNYSIYPEGLYRALLAVNKLGLPIYVTENGIADRQDDRRAVFIRQYLHALACAIEAGVDVRGYYYWSLVDNFEWAEGYAMKFGLFEVDFATQKRSLRKGSHAYQDIVRKYR